MAPGLTNLVLGSSGSTNPRLYVRVETGMDDSTLLYGITKNNNFSRWMEPRKLWNGRYASSMDDQPKIMTNI